MTLQFITWSVQPEMLRIGGWAIRWYGLLFAAGFFFGYILLTNVFKKENVPQKYLDELTTWMIIATVVGARLGHCFFYEPEYYLSNPLKILAVWEGGLASHGAGIMIVITILVYSRIRNFRFLWIMDRIVMVVALAGFLIRMGNLMNSEIYGVATTLPWGFIFTRNLNPGDPLVAHHPTQIYEALSYLLIFFYLIRYYYRKNGKPEEGYIFGVFLALVFGARFLIEFVKEPQVGFEQNMILNMGQLLSIPFVLAGLALIYNAKRKKA